MATITTRSGKGSPLTNNEVDSNFTNLNNDKLETSGGTLSGDLSVTGDIAVTGTIDGRDVATDGAKLDGIEANATADQTAAEIRTLVDSATNSNVFTDADHTKLNGIEAGATGDQTNAEIRAAVEAATDSNVFTDADHSKLDGIEALADVTDTANVTAAGALMDTEVTNLAQVKAFDSADYATAAQGITADSALQNVVEDTTPQLGGDLDLNSNNITGTGGLNITGNIALTGTVDGRDVATDGAKLDGIESGATADQTAAEIRTLVESASDSNVFTDADHSKLDGIEASADVTDTTNVVAALTAGTNVSIAADGTISSTDTNTTYSVGDGGLTEKNFTTALKSKLDGIASGAEVNVNADWNASSGDAQILNKPTIPSLSGYATESYVNTQVSNLVDSSPAALDTLNELAAALGDDANFSTTVSNQIGTKWTQDNTKISNWDTAYGWGNHASAGYLTSHQDISGKLDTSAYTASDVLTKIKTVDGAGSGLDADLLDGQHGSHYLNYNNLTNKPTIPTNTNQLTNGSGYITGNQTITLTGDVSGSGTTSINVTVADNSHNHSGSNITTGTVSAARIANLDASKITSGTFNAARIPHNAFDIGDTTAETGRSVHETGIYTFNRNNGTLGAGTDSAYYSVLGFGQGTGGMVQIAGKWTSPHDKLYWRSLRDTTDNWWSWKAIFHDTYHPNADKWTTARTLSLTGDVTGSVSWDGSANASLTTTIADDSHNHVISNVDGLQSALDSKLASSSYTASDVLTKIKTVDGNGSGLDADTVDGVHESTFMRRTANSSLNMVNNNITNVNHLTFNDAGVGEGLEWLGGSGWKVFESPNALTNASGNLQFVTGSTRRMTLDTNSTLEVQGALVSQGGTWSSNIDSVSNGSLIMDKGDFIYSDDNSYLRKIIGHTTGGTIEVGQAGTALISQINLIPGTAGNSAVKVNGNTVWNAGNDGSGSGLDADTCDGQHLGTSASVQFGSVLSTGNVTAYSDRRIKENITPITEALSKVQKLTGNTYTRNDQEDTATRYAGLIAQEVEEVLPEAVREADDGIKVLDYNATIALLVESIKELKSEVDDLKAQLEKK